MIGTREGDASEELQRFHADRPAESIAAADSAGGRCPEEGPAGDGRGKPPPGGWCRRDGAILAAQFLEDGHLKGAEEAVRASRGDAVPIQDGSFTIQVEVEGDPGGGLDAQEGVCCDVHTHQPWPAD